MLEQVRTALKDQSVEFKATIGGKEGNLLRAWQRVVHKLGLSFDQVRKVIILYATGKNQSKDTPQ